MIAVYVLLGNLVISLAFACENGTYGEGCSSTCGHCQNQTDCYHVNGSCLTGCEPGYHGELCQTYNLAFNKPTYQQNRDTGLPYYLSQSSNAVDGLKEDLSLWGGQCVISANARYTATWWVNLTRTFSISYITVSYMTSNSLWGSTNGYTSRFLGFSLYVSNTTEISDGTLCFKDTIFSTSTIPAVFNTTCPVLGQYVIYYNERLPGVTYPNGYSYYAYNELCEVEVFGGCSDPGYYGLNCSIPCPDLHCRYCQMETGSCLECEQGYEGRHCESVCGNGTYGLNCNETCGHCQAEEDCNHIDGTCLTGCKPGYVGVFCNSHCSNETYGLDCVETCGHCRDGDCDPINGTCLSGCEAGYIDRLCKLQNLAFNKPTFQGNPYTGLQEDWTQSSNAVDGLKSDLSRWGGQCVLSSDGRYTATWWVNLTSIFRISYVTVYYTTDNEFWGPYNRYAPRFLGFSLYVSNTTDRQDGTLCFKDTKFNVSSIPAVFNTTCNVDGQYVIYNNERLPGVTYPDDYSVYAYSELCEVEVFGYCSDQGYYGFDCSIPCPDPHCRYCHTETGTCQECEPGYEGHHCESVCGNGTYGLNCNETCGYCQAEEDCHHINGTCINGCKPGYVGICCNSLCGNGTYGLKCNESCGQCQAEEDCHHINGTCLTGCKPGYIGVLCNSSCENAKYGQGCNSRCGHCENEDDCYHTNGTCLIGCQPGYQGDFCKTHNLAFNKPTYQRNPNTGLAESLIQSSNAVDGKKSDLSVWGGQCVVSDVYKQTATWRVNLLSMHSIYYITIYFRTENSLWGPFNGFTSRFLGFSLYVSNTTEKSDGTLCFKDTSFTLDTIPAVFNITCFVHGQYVIYYNERLPGVTYPDGYSKYAHNELCEVEVIEGCPEPGYYGSDCSIPCSDPNCRYCNMEWGSCMGCKHGYRGHHCELECMNGYFGEDCKEKCGYCLHPAQCHHVNGTCFDGCEPGFKGEDCKQLCESGVYGSECKETCGNCFSRESCFHIDGTCVNGCDPGYNGDLCKTQCMNGYFGEKCKEKCGYCSDLTQCHHVNGTCFNGCEPGFKGEHCNQVCEPGTYGSKCNETCGNCLYKDTCSHTNGTCASGCDPGYTGDLCNTTCGPGMYGTDCDEKCGHCGNPEDCSNVNGSCLSGCAPGYFGHMCKTPCQSGTYGQECKNNCGYCLNNADCFHVDGTCVKGCQPGYSGDICKARCNSGMYGMNCEHQCGHCMDLVNCFHVNGTCLNGCDSGYIGNLCKAPCGYGTYGQNCKEVCGPCRDQQDCHNVNGLCLTGCESGFYGGFCNLTCENGTYGKECNETCGYCREDDSCYHTNGVCLHGCNPGYIGDLCKTECSPGFYGENCSSVCRKCADGAPCHHINGSCLHSLFCYEVERLLKQRNQESETNDNGGTITGLYVVISLLSILLAIALCVIILLGRYIRHAGSWRQNCLRNDPQNYDKENDLQEMHQYITIDSVNQESHYQDISKPSA